MINIKKYNTKDFAEVKCVSCDQEFKESGPTEIYFSEQKKIILICDSCYKQLSDLILLDEIEKIEEDK